MGKAKERNKDKLHGKKTLKVESFFQEIEKEAVKKQVDLVALFSFFDVALSAKGKTHMGRCPWHEDSTPSLSVSREKGMYNCFGCGESGDAINLVEKMQGVKFREALVWLSKWNNGHRGDLKAKAWWHNAKGSSDVVKDKAGASLSLPPAVPPQNRHGDPEEDIEPRLEPEPLPGNQEKAPPIPASTFPSPTKGQGAANGEEAFSPGQEAANDVEQAGVEPEPETKEKPASPSKQEVKQNLRLAVIAEHYQKALYVSRIATSYLERRGITNKELFSRYYLGYADGSLTSKLSTTQRQELKKLGILNQTGREHFRNCITIPLLDDQGQVSGFYGRAISETSKLKHRYQPGPHKGLFNHKAAKVYDHIILTESIIDALSLLQIGLENVIPCYGTNGFTEAHLKALKDNLVKTVIVAFDNDEAGSKATEKLKTRLLTEDFKVKIIISPTTKDWNQELLNGLSKELVINQIETAQLFEPPKEKTQLTVTREGPKYLFTLGSILYRLLGVKELFVANLRVNIRLEYNQEKYIDNVDLYAARSRNSFAANAASLFSLEVKRIENDLVTILEHLEVERDKQLKIGEEKPAELTEEEKELGMAFLTSPDMFEQIVADTETLGYLGDELNKQLLYIAASSRKLQDPISLLVISESSAGKSLLIEIIKELMPEEEVVAVTSLSDQALNYFTEGGLLHKFLILGEAVHTDVVDHQIREMLSANELSRLVTIKDPKTGQLTSRIQKTKTIVSLMMSTTNHKINPENASRFFEINVDESIVQTRSIQKRQHTKHALSRYAAKSKKIPQIKKKHKSAQRLLKERIIVNPLGPYLDFPKERIRTRRDNDRFMDLIAGVCFLRQYQKEVKKEQVEDSEEEIEYIECDLEDYRIAYRIMVEGVLRSTYAELPVSCVGLYDEIRSYCREEAQEAGLKATEVSFTQRELKERVKWLGSVSIKKYLKELVSYEYLYRSRGGGRGERSHYRLVSDEAVGSLDLSVIPAPDEIERKLKSG